MKDEDILELFTTVDKTLESYGRSLLILSDSLVLLNEELKSLIKIMEKKNEMGSR